MVVKLTVDEKRAQVNPVYVSFMDALQLTYNLKDLVPDNLKWVGVDNEHKLESPVYVPSLSRISVAKDHPMMSVSLYPMTDGKLVTEFERYPAVLLMRDAQPWSVSESLRQYRVNGWSGVPEERSMFKQARSVKEIVETLDGLKDGIKPDTDVVEAVAFLPISSNGEFETEFNPYISYDTHGHTHYRVTAFTEDKINVFCGLTDGNPMEIKELDEKQVAYNRKARFVPDLSAIEQLLLPSSTGHMILIAVPYERPTPKYNIYLSRSKLDDYGLGDFMSGRDTMRTMSFRGSPRSASVGNISIGRGSESGRGRLYDGELQESSHGNPVIYHFRFLGVKPDQVESLTPDVLNELGETLSSHEKV